ncbi:MAG TPA: glycerol-3-phosphate 1-O-acyltransferase PlsY [Candidatus Binatia bacterium]|nr:glycerol-3-phosphate 1-O-acyltransferase PlsY [Candidatus Binatia bacterium]
MIAELGLVAVASYLVGSIPSGYLLARWKRVDVRTTGSGNIGATNVARSVGKGLGAATLVLDAAKGAIPALVVAGIDWEARANPALAATAPVVAGVAALVGHCFPVTLGFRGGKGVATALGVLIALAPGTLPIALAAFAAVFAAFRRVSLASIAAAVAAPATASWLGYPSPVVTGICAMALLIIYRHRSNIARLLAGTEPRFESSRSSSPS